MYMLCRLLLVLLPFFLAIVLSVLLRFTDSDYPFGIFKLFLYNAVDTMLIKCNVCLVFIFQKWVKGRKYFCGWVGKSSKNKSCAQSNNALTINTNSTIHWNFDQAHCILFLLSRLVLCRGRLYPGTFQSRHFLLYLPIEACGTIWTWLIATVMHFWINL